MQYNNEERVKKGGMYSIEEVNGRWVIDDFRNNKPIDIFHPKDKHLFVPIRPSIHDMNPKPDRGARITAARPTTQDQLRNIRYCYPKRTIKAEPGVHDHAHQGDLLEIVGEHGEFVHVRSVVNDKLKYLPADKLAFPEGKIYIAYRDGSVDGQKVLEKGDLYEVTIDHKDQWIVKRLFKRTRAYINQQTHRGCLLPLRPGHYID